jgi:hypothetical protein
MAELKQPLSKKDVINVRLLYVEACSLYDDQQKFNISYLVFCEIVEFKSTIQVG